MFDGDQDHIQSSLHHQEQMSQLKSLYSVLYAINTTLGTICWILIIGACVVGYRLWK